MQVQGDAFLARVFDNEDDFERLDFTLREVASSAPWVKEAAAQNEAKMKGEGAGGILRRMQVESPLQCLCQQHRPLEAGMTSSARASRLCSMLWLHLHGEDGIKLVKCTSDISLLVLQFLPPDTQRPWLHCQWVQYQLTLTLHHELRECCRG